MKKKIARLRRASRARFRFARKKTMCLVIHRTSCHIYAQIIDSSSSKVLVSSSTLEKKLFAGLKFTGNKQAAFLVGETVGERAIKNKIYKVSFDRSGFKYHGRVKMLAEGARKQGLKF